jgi:hypothetical protein
MQFAQKKFFVLGMTKLAMRDGFSKRFDNNRRLRAATVERKKKEKDNLKYLRPWHDAKLHHDRLS